MYTKLSRTLAISLLALSLSASASIALAWTAPTLPPPAGNVDEPINASSTPQIKAGKLTVWDLLTGGDVLSTGGVWSTGYGPRSDGAPISFKDWAGNILATINTLTGNVGIGTVDPKAKLDVVGRIYSKGSNAEYSFIGWDGTDINNASYLYAGPRATGWNFIGSNKNGAGVLRGLGFTIGGGDDATSVKMAIDTAGNVGIGTTDFTGITGSGNLKVSGKIYGEGSGLTGLTKAMVGLTNVDNTSDANKPVSTAQQTALNLKENAISAGTTGQYWRGDKTWQTLPTAAVTSVFGRTGAVVAASGDYSVGQVTGAAPTASPTFTGTVSGITKAMVGLGSVDNTADTAKPVSTAQQTALNLKANLASPTFTGSVTMPGSGIWNSSGNVGIGIAPSYKFEVSGGTTYLHSNNPNANALWVGENVQIDGKIRGATYGFGGMYSVYTTNGSCSNTNVLSGWCSCPSGFTASLLTAQNISGINFTAYYCWR